MAPNADLVQRLRRTASACPTDSERARQWHQLARRDAELAQPLTAHGRALRSSGRPWPGVGQVGECLCGSSLVFHAAEDFDIPAAAPVASAANPFA